MNARKQLACMLLFIAAGAGIYGVYAVYRSALDSRSVHSGQAAAERIDWLAGRWQMAGSKLEAGKAGGKNRLSVSGKNLSIVRQDGSPGQKNPPVNLYGSYLRAGGDFTVEASLSGMKGPAGIYLYGNPPLIEDELRAETATLAIIIGNGTMRASVGTAKDGRDASTAAYKVAASESYDIRISNEGGRIYLALDGRQLGSIPDKSVFSAGNVWFGAEAIKPGGSFMVDRLTAYGRQGAPVTMADGASVAIPLDASGLAALATGRRPGFKVGAAVALGPVIADGQYRRLLGNFNSITTENAFKFQFIHPMPGNSPSAYDFAETDALVAVGEANKIAVQAHTLVFAEANPQWLQNALRRDPGQAAAILNGHITTVMQRYKGRIQGYDLLNEVLADYDTPAGTYGLRKNLWYDALGPAYLVAAIKAARQADPEAELWINEFGLESDDDRFNQMVGLLQWLKSQDALPTGVGFQAHIDEGDTILNDTAIDTGVLRKRFQTLAQLGLKARISELDVTNLSQAPVFAQVFEACLSELNCTGVTTWGITDAYSSAGSLDSSGRFIPGTGLLWDAAYQPTAGLNGVLGLLRR